MPRAVRTAAGTIAERRGLWLTLTDTTGSTATGEAAPLPGFSAESLADVRAVLESLRGPGSPLGGRNIANPEDILRLLDELGWPSAASHALDQALLGLLAAVRGTPVSLLLGARPEPGESELHRLVASPSEARAAVVDDVRTLKVKVGAASVEADLERLRAIRAAAPGVALRLDANGAWSEEVALGFLERAVRLGVELVEDPVVDGRLDALRRLRSAVPTVSVAVDAGCRTMADLDALIAAEAADAVVLKPMLCGGPSRAAAMARRAAEAGLRVMVTTTFDSEVALSAARAVAAACPAEARLACGLDPVAAVCHAPVIPKALPDPVRGAAIARPDHPAVVLDDGTSLTWRQLDERVGRFAAVLATRGVVSGDVVALTGLASLDGVAALWATGRLGAAALPLGARTVSEQTRALESASPDHVIAVADLASAVTSERRPPRDLPLDEARLVVLTGGTSGQPRPVALTTSQLAFSALGSALRIGHDPEDRWLLALPLDHVGGLSVLVRTALAGTTTLLHRRFDPARVARALDDGDATVASLVPEMLARVLDVRGARPFPPSVRALLLGGAPAPAALLAWCREIDAPVALTWGMTEAASQIATRFPGDLGPDVGAPPLATARVEVDDSGRLWVAGPIVSAGRLATADRGEVDASGRVQVRGRVDDVFVSGGQNVDPAEVEATLLGHPAVAAALVAGVPDPRWGARPVAALVARDSSDRPDDDAVRAWIGERLSGFKRPDRFLWLEDLPRTPLGKPSRAALRELTMAREG